MQRFFSACEGVLKRSHGHAGGGGGGEKLPKVPNIQEELHSRRHLIASGHLILIFKKKKKPGIFRTENKNLCIILAASFASPWIQISPPVRYDQHKFLYCCTVIELLLWTLLS